MMPLRQSTKQRTFEITEKQRREAEEWHKWIREHPGEWGRNAREDLPARFTDPIQLVPVIGYEARARGAMLGLAVGDALGTTLEFSQPTAPAFPEFAQWPHRDITGGGPFGLEPGQVTDDAQMASCLATSLMIRGEFDVNDVLDRYRQWSKCAFDIGTQTRAALHSGLPALQSGRAVWEAQGRSPAGNGSLMRTAPLALCYWNSPGACQRASLADSALTHFDPRCQIACAVLNATIAAAVDKEGSFSEIYYKSDDEIELASRSLLAAYPDLQTEISRARDDLRRDMEFSKKDDPQLYGPELHLHQHAGFVRVAFRLAFWELWHAPTFEEALIDVVNRGGDADTNAAITGALLGAVAGEEEIPLAWRTAVLDSLQHDHTTPFATTYHPRVLTDFVTSMKAQVTAEGGIYKW